MTSQSPVPPSNTKGNYEKYGHEDEIDHNDRLNSPAYICAITSKIIDMESQHTIIQSNILQNRANQGRMLKHVKADLSIKAWENYTDEYLKEILEIETRGSEFNMNEADTLIRLHELAEKYPAFLHSPGMTFDKFAENEEWITKKLGKNPELLSQEVVDDLWE